MTSISTYSVNNSSVTFSDKLEIQCWRVDCSWYHSGYGTVAVNMGLEVSFSHPGHLLHLVYRHPPIHVSKPFSSLCIHLSMVDVLSPESPRWLVHEGHFEAARTAVAQTNANGDVSDPVALTIYKEIVDTLEWEKKEGRTMSPKEIVKTPTARKRFLIGMSPGPFSCVAGNIIASYYLGAELDTAGVTDSNDQLKAVSPSPTSNTPTNHPSPPLRSQERSPHSKNPSNS